MSSDDRVPAVSVDCITYNQAAYVGKCLDGMLAQKCSFAWEILVHDDASSDGTAGIIREYQSRRPDLILPILQSENQHSRGLSVSTFNWRRARGKYIAMCEGDDYWTDPEKLQRQFDFMEAHPEYSMCCHRALVLDESDGGRMKPYNRFGGPLPGRDRDLALDDIIRYDGSYIPTASLFFRRSCLEGFMEFKKGCPYGDYPLQMYLGMQGKVRYFASDMAVYRRSGDSSYTRQYADDNRFARRTMEEVNVWLKRIRGAYPLPGKAMDAAILNNEMQNMFLHPETTFSAYAAKLLSPAGISYFLRLKAIDQVYLLLRALHIDPHRLAGVFSRRPPR